MTISQTQLKQLEQRTVNFSVAIIKASVKYSADAALRPVINNLVESATNIGAHYAEANGASNKADFATKIRLAKQSADQTRYWLKILTELLPKDNVNRLSQEALKLTLVLQKIATTLENSE